MKNFRFVNYAPHRTWTFERKHKQTSTFLVLFLQKKAFYYVTLIYLKVKISYNGTDEIGVEGSDLDDTYHLKSLHFHWGYNEYQGSEHTINGIKFPLEVKVKQ